jgi:hypothetical protein
VATSGGFWVAIRAIARALAGFTRRAVVSIVDRYRKTEHGFRELDQNGYEVQSDFPQSEALGILISRLAELARQASLEILSCAEDIDLRPFGILPGKCIDDTLIERVFGLRVTALKDPTQRSACACVKSRDIGIYNTCPAGCRYCYATTNHSRALEAVSQHDERSPSVLGWFEAETSDAPNNNEQLRLPLHSLPFQG